MWKKATQKSLRTFIKATVNIVPNYNSSRLWKNTFTDKQTNLWLIYSAGLPHSWEFIKLLTGFPQRKRSLQILNEIPTISHDVVSQAVHVKQFTDDLVTWKNLQLVIGERIRTHDSSPAVRDFNNQATPLLMTVVIRWVTFVLYPFIFVIF